jgi:cell division protein FtsW
MFRSLGERTSIKSNARHRRTYSSAMGGLGAHTPHLDETIRPLSRSSRKSRTIQFRFDILLVLVVFTLIIFGLLMVYSASYDYSFNWYGDPNTILWRQIAWLGVGLTAMISLFFVDYHTLGKVVVPLMGLTIFLLIGVLFVNEVLNGASRTLYRGSIQPSELAKLVTVLYLSIWLNARREQLSDVKFGLIPLAAILGILGGLIMIQPDLSAVVTILTLGGLMFFLAGGDLRQIAILLLVSILIGVLVIQVHPTGSERIADYLAGLKDPTEGSYHVQRSLEAFVNGGWFGVGIGRATTKVTGLPVPPTDSIFAVVGEETGVFGALGLVGLYSLLLWRGLTIAQRAPDEMGALVAAGLSAWICMEAFINMSVLVSLLPFAGNALPFISSGGSNLVASMAAIGIVLNISRVSVHKKEEKGKLFNAVIDLRGRNRRRSVSGARRPASAGK